MGIVWDINVERPEFPQLTTNLEADLVVVGLGGSGLTALLHAAQRGLNVIGIDSDRIAAGAAGRNGGAVRPRAATGRAGRDGVPAAPRYDGC